MAVILAEVTQDAQYYWPQMHGGLLPFKTISHFRIGGGGWVETETGRQRRLPDASLHDLDCITDLTRPTGSKRYVDPQPYYEKALTLSDITFESPSTIRIRCTLDFNEFNSDFNGGNPNLWELGIFSDHPDPAFVGKKLMVAYGTFPKEIKDGSKQLENILRITF